MKGRHAIIKSSTAPTMLVKIFKTPIFYFLAPSSLKDIFRIKITPSFGIQH